jgi:hypothetical protein
LIQQLEKDLEGKPDAFEYIQQDSLFDCASCLNDLLKLSEQFHKKKFLKQLALSQKMQDLIDSTIESLNRAIAELTLSSSLTTMKSAMRIEMKIDESVSQVIRLFLINHIKLQI